MTCRKSNLVVWTRERGLRSVEDYYSDCCCCCCLVAKLCPALHSVMGYSLPGSSVYRISQARMGCHFFLQGIFPTQGSNPHLLHWCMHACCCFSHNWLFATPWTIAPRLLCPWILQARTLECVAVPSSRGSSQPRDQTHISCLLHWQADSLPLVPPG